MRHDYYYYSKEQLLAAPRLPITVMEDDAAVFRTIAQEMAEEIQRKNALGERTVFICPVGPVGQYPYFVELVNTKGISLKDVWFLNMDEYLTDGKEWVDKGHPLSFRGFMDRAVYSKIDPALIMPEAQRIFPDPKDPERMWRTIQELGGVDICFGGIGINGHVAFNEAQDELTPDQFRALPTRVLQISLMPMVTHQRGMSSTAPLRSPIALAVRVSREISSTRVGRARNWSGVSSSWASLKATWPLMPMPPKQMSTPPRA